MKYIILTILLCFSFSLSCQHIMLAVEETAPPSSATEEETAPIFGFPDFRIVVNTANAGVSASDQFQFTGALGDYDVHVYDQTGTTKLEEITGLSDAATITISAGSGIYELRVFPATTNGFNRINFNNAGDGEKLIEIKNWGSNVEWSSFVTSFRACSNLTDISASTPPNTSSVTAFSSTFELIGAPTGTYNLSDWVFPTGSNLRRFVAGCKPTGGITGLESWDLSRVTSIEEIFRFSFDHPDRYDLSGWDVSNVTNMVDVFEFSNTEAVATIASWDISNVTAFGSDFTNTTNSSIVTTAQYDQILISWEQTLQAAYPGGVGYTPNISIKFAGLTYTLGGAAEAARTSLINTYGWTITDGGGI